MYRKVVTALMVVFLLSGAVLSADDAHGRDIDIIIEEIMEQTGAESRSEVSAEEVSPELLEELGDAVMESIIYDKVHHEMIDYMLGGEDSEQLAAYHRDLGTQYILSGDGLGALGPYGGRGWMPHLGAYRYAPFQNDWNADYPGFSRWTWGGPLVLAGVGLIAVILIILGIRKRPGSPDQALMILKRRYALGKITKDEFERMKGVLSS